jgi:type IV secretory pathway TrbD component
MGKSILMVAEKPAIAQAIATALAGGQVRFLTLQGLATANLILCLRCYLRIFFLVIWRVVEFSTPEKMACSWLLT